MSSLPTGVAQWSEWMFSAASVCLFVSLFANTITSDQLNVGWSNLVVRCTVQKSHPSWNVKVKVTGTKKRKSAAFCSGFVLWDAVLRQFYAGGKISKCCVVNDMLNMTSINAQNSLIIG